MYMKWVTATEIDNWTALEPRRAQETVPLLVWKLILASCKSVNDHHFPYGKAIQYPGYDGALDTDDESPFFPTGKSVWEIGTNEDAQNKFKATPHNSQIALEQIKMANLSQPQRQRRTTIKPRRKAVQPE